MTASATRLHICCVRPGLIRGGVRHPQYASHALDAFADADLAEILAEPLLTVIVGTLATPEAVERAIAGAAVPGAPQAAPADAAAAVPADGAEPGAEAQEDAPARRRRAVRARDDAPSGA